MKQNVEKAFYHINSAGENVVFREESDFIQFMNDIALAGFSTRTEILAFSILSTHFHLCVITEHIVELVRKLNQAYTRYFHNKYEISGKIMDIEVWEKLDINQQFNALNYVLKNAVHHEVSFSPFQYPYSSIDCYFKNNMTRQERFEYEYPPQNIIHPSNLSGREKRRIFRWYNLPDIYLIQDRRLIMPKSYINARIVEGYYRNNYRSFLVEMNRNIIDNAENKEGGKRFVTTESLSISSQRISDIEVCKVINDLVNSMHRKSFKDFSPNEITMISQSLQRLGSIRPQIQRCLWL